MKTERFIEYRVSERVVLKPGDTFKASGGPYWKASNGVEASLKAPGPYKFVAYVKRGVIGWIEAYDKNGCIAILHVEGRRKKVDCAIVARPYRVIGKKRPKKQRLLQRLDNRRPA